MKNKLIISVFSFLLCFSGWSWAQMSIIETLPTIDVQRTQLAPWKQGQIVMSGEIILGVDDQPEDIERHTVNRKFLGVTTDGYYVVQDFFVENNQKRTEPYITTKERVTQLVIAPETGFLTLYHPNGLKKEEVFYERGHEIGLLRLWSENGARFGEVTYESERLKRFQLWHDNGELKIDA